MRFRSSLLVALAVASFQMAYAPARGQSGSDAVAEFTEKRCQSSGSAAVVSYRLDRKALGPEGRETLESGTTLTFVHRLSIMRRRPFFDKLLARTVVEVSATLDTLTHQYTLTRMIDGKVSATASTEEYRDVEKWLCEGKDIEIHIPTEDKQGSLEFRIRSQYRRIFAVYLFPTELTAYGNCGCGP